MHEFIYGLRIPFLFIYMSIIMLVTYCLDYCGFTVSFEIVQVWVLQLSCFPLARFFWLFRVPWICIWILRSSCHFCKLLTPMINFGSIYTFKILNLPVHKHDIYFLFLCLLLRFSLSCWLCTVLLRTVCVCHGSPEKEYININIDLRYLYIYM